MDDQKKEIDTTFQNTEMTLKQIQEKKKTATDTVVSNVQAQIQYRFPSQLFQNPKENVSAMKLRGRKMLKGPRKNREVENKVEV